jgi:hypothetical protein
MNEAHGQMASSWYLTKSVCASDELDRWPLCVFGRKKYFAERSFERFNPAREVQPLKDLYLTVVQPHTKVFIKIDQAGVECAVISGRESDAVMHAISTSGRSHRKNMRCIDQTKLNPRHSASVSICK